MYLNNKKYFFVWLILVIGGGWLLTGMSSCGKQGNASPKGLNIQYHVLNLSPDIYPLDLFVDNRAINRTPFIYGVDQGYFYLPSIDLPFQIRSAINIGNTFFTRNDILKSGAKYTLFISGSFAANSLDTIFTVDTSIAPKLGRGKLRFVNASPTATDGLDVYVNDTLAFHKVVYSKYSNYIELPVGNYDMHILATGTTNVIKDLPGVIIQDGKLYTLYGYGYTSRADTAAFNAAVITNK